MDILHDACAPTVLPLTSQTAMCGDLQQDNGLESLTSCRRCSSTSSFKIQVTATSGSCTELLSASTADPTPSATKCDAEAMATKVVAIGACAGRQPSSAAPPTQGAEASQRESCQAESMQAAVAQCELSQMPPAAPLATQDLFKGQPAAHSGTGSLHEQPSKSVAVRSAADTQAPTSGASKTACSAGNSKKKKATSTTAASSSSTIPSRAATTSTATVSSKSGSSINATAAAAAAASTALAAAKLGLMDQLSTALSAAPAAAGLRDMDGRCCLHYAAGYGHEECVDLLLSKGGQEAVRMRDANGDLPLHLAAQQGQPMCAYNIAKVCPACCLVKNKRGQSPIDVAAAAARGEVLNALLLACAGDGKSAVAVAAMRLLLAAGAVPDTWAPNGSSALMLAAAADGVTALQVLLEGGATMELQDALGRSALMFAAGNGAAAACQVLLDAKASMSSRDRRGRAALDYAPAGSEAAVLLKSRLEELEAVAKQRQEQLLLEQEGHEQRQRDSSKTPASMAAACTSTTSPSGGPVGGGSSSKKRRKKKNSGGQAAAEEAAEAVVCEVELPTALASNTPRTGGGAKTTGPDPPGASGDVGPLPGPASEDLPGDAVAACGSGSIAPRSSPSQAVEGSPAAASCAAAALQTPPTADSSSADMAQVASRGEALAGDEQMDVGQEHAEGSCLEEERTASSQRDDWQVVVPKNKQRAGGGGGGGSNSGGCAKGAVAPHSAGKGSGKQVALRACDNPASEKQQQHVQHAAVATCRPPAAGTSHAVGSKGRSSMELSKDQANCDHLHGLSAAVAAAGPTSHPGHQRQDSSHSLCSNISMCSYESCSCSSLANSAATACTPKGGAGSSCSGMTCCSQHSTGEQCPVLLQQQARRPEAVSYCSSSSSNHSGCADGLPASSAWAARTAVGGPKTCAAATTGNSHALGSKTSSSGGGGCATATISNNGSSSSSSRPAPTLANFLTQELQQHLQQAHQHASAAAAPAPAAPCQTQVKAAAGPAALQPGAEGGSSTSIRDPGATGPTGDFKAVLLGLNANRTPCMERAAAVGQQPEKQQQQQQQQEAETGVLADPVTSPPPPPPPCVAASDAVAPTTASSVEAALMLATQDATVQHLQQQLQQAQAEIATLQRQLKLQGQAHQQKLAAVLDDAAAHEAAAVQAAAEAAVAETLHSPVLLQVLSTAVQQAVLNERTRLQLLLQQAGLPPATVLQLLLATAVAHAQPTAAPAQPAAATVAAMEPLSAAPTGGVEGSAVAAFIKAAAASAATTAPSGAQLAVAGGLVAGAVAATADYQTAFLQHQQQEAKVGAAQHQQSLSSVQHGGKQLGSSSGNGPAAVAGRLPAGLLSSPGLQAAEPSAADSTHLPELKLDLRSEYCGGGSSFVAPVKQPAAPGSNSASFGSSASSKDRRWSDAAGGGAGRSMLTGLLAAAADGEWVGCCSDDVMGSSSSSNRSSLVLSAGPSPGSASGSAEGKHGGSLGSSVATHGSLKAPRAAATSSAVTCAAGAEGSPAAGPAAIKGSAAAGRRRSSSASSDCSKPSTTASSTTSSSNSGNDTHQVRTAGSSACVTEPLPCGIATAAAGGSGNRCSSSDSLAMSVADDVEVPEALVGSFGAIGGRASSPCWAAATTPSSCRTSLIPSRLGRHALVAFGPDATTAAADHGWTDGGGVLTPGWSTVGLPEAAADAQDVINMLPDQL